MKERDEPDAVLDAEIDAALTTYVYAEARQGLVQRVLAVTNGCEPRRGLRWLAFAVPVLAAILLVAMLLRRHADSPSETQHVVAQVPSVAPRVILPAIPARPNPSFARGAVKVRDSHIAQSPLPRREVFPTPVPLTAEEQALLGGKQNSEQVSAQLARSASRSDEPAVDPIHIAAIHIPPLNPPDNGSN